MPSLYSITGEFLALYEMSEDEEAFADTLESLEFDLEVKAKGYAQIINQLNMEADEAERVSKAFAAKAKARRNNVKYLMQRMNAAMELLDKDEVSAGDFKIKRIRNGGQAPLIIDGEVPDNMKKITVENDNAKIREFLKDAECSWAHIGERGYHIEVK